MILSPQNQLASNTIRILKPQQNSCIQIDINNQDLTSKRTV